MYIKQRQWLLILEDAKRKKMALDNQRKETSLQQHDAAISSSDAAGIYIHTSLEELIFARHVVYYSA